VLSTFFYVCDGKRKESDATNLLAKFPQKWKNQPVPVWYCLISYVEVFDSILAWNTIFYIYKGN
jgi:hypothetical protein